MTRSYGGGALCGLLRLDSFLVEVFCKTSVHMLYVRQPVEVSKSLCTQTLHVSGKDNHTKPAHSWNCGLGTPGGHWHRTHAFWSTW